MELLAILKILWARRRVLILATAAAVVAALPFAVLRPPLYSSTTQVVIPDTDPSAKSQQLKTSALTLRLKTYEIYSYAPDVVKRMGREGRKITSVTAVPNTKTPEVTMITVEAKTQGAAKKGAHVAADTLFAKSNAFADAAVARLHEDITRQVADRQKEIDALQAEKDSKQADVNAVQAQIDQLNQRINAINATLAKAAAGAARVDAAAAQREIQQSQAQIAARQGDLQARQAALRDVNTRYDQAVSQRDGLLTLAKDAVDANAARRVASTMVAAPSRPESNMLIRLLETLALAIAAGLLVSGAAVVWSERRRVLPLVRSALGSPPPGATVQPAEAYAPSPQSLRPTAPS